MSPQPLQVKGTQETERASSGDQEGRGSGQLQQKVYRRLVRGHERECTARLSILKLLANHSTEEVFLGTVFPVH